jgi:hypothetical protein
MKLEKPLYLYVENKSNLPWYLSTSVGIEYGPTGSTVADSGFMESMTGSDIIKKAQIAGAEYVIIFSKDTEFAYYHSKLRPSPQSLNNRDILLEVCDAAKGTDIKVLAYMVCQYDSYAMRNHPDWEMVGQDGRKLGRVCLRNPGFIEHNKSVIDELCAYDIVGIHVDMLDMGFSPPYGCWCNYCKSVFKEKYGYDMPDLDFDDPKWENGQEFRYDFSRPLIEGLTEHLKNNYQGISIDFNYHGGPPFSHSVGERPFQHAQYGDFITAESLPWAFGYHNVSATAHLLKAACPNSHAQLVGSRSIYNYHEYTLRPEKDFLFEAMTILALGCSYTVVDKAGYDGWFDPLFYERIAPVFAEIKEKAKYCLGFNNTAVTAIYFSNRTRDYFFRDNYVEFNNGVNGAGRMLAQLHIPYTFIFDENLSLGTLANIKVLILPNTALIIPEEAAILREYVKNGGRLLALGPIGICDKQGRLTETCLLEDVFGAKFDGVCNNSDDTFVGLPDNTPDGQEDLIEGLRSEWFLHVKGKAYGFKKTTASTFGDIMVGFRPGQSKELEKIRSDIWDQIMSAGEKVAPAIFINQFFEGQAIMLPCMLSSAYIGTLRSPEQRKLFSNILRRLLPCQSVSAITLPLDTEMMINRDPVNGDILVHLVTFNGIMAVPDGSFFEGKKALPSVMEESKLYYGKLKINFSYKSITAVSGTSFYDTDGMITFTCDKVHECFIIKV